MLNVKNDGQDSLKKRYSYRLFSGIVGGVLGLVTYGIVPRSLGPVAYGNFSFLTDFFQQLTGFFNMGTSAAFYTKLSKRQEEHKLEVFYTYFLLTVAVIIVAFLGIAYALSIKNIIWPAQQWIFICAAALWALLTWYSQIVNQILDAHGLTVQSEIIRIFERFLSIFLILALFFAGIINLGTFFAYHYILLGFLCICWLGVLRRNDRYFWKDCRLPLNEMRGYAHEFYVYCHPIVFASLVGLVTGIFDRWLLQKFAGSVEQGFFGFSYKVGGMCFLFTGAMSMLLMREFSVSFGRGDIKGMALLFRRYVPLMYSVTAYFACFVALQASKIIYIFGGNMYRNALVAVTIMAFYPVHQTYGQFGGAVFLAAGRTALKRNIEIAFSLVGLPVTYLLIAPRAFMGMDAGANGLAIKMVLLQFIFVNVDLFFNVRLLRLPFRDFFGHQIFSVALFLIAASLATFGVDNIICHNGDVITRFLLAGVIYTLIVAGYARFMPSVFGLGHEDIRAFVRTAAGKLRKAGA